MLTRERSLAIFLSATDELINSKYILADSKVGAILKAVAQSRMLYETFEYVTYGYDYSAAKSVCFVDGGVSLPQKDEDVLAFVFLTLMEIDAGREDVMRILNDYFGGDNGMQNAYAAFADKMLKPFRDIAEKTFGKIISGEMPTVGKGEKKPKTPNRRMSKQKRKRLRYLTRSRSPKTNSRGRAATARKNLHIYSRNSVMRKKNPTPIK